MNSLSDRVADSATTATDSARQVAEHVGWGVTPFAIIVGIIALFGVMAAISALTGSSKAGDTSQGQAAASAKKRMSPFGYVAVGFAVVCVMTLTSVRKTIQPSTTAGEVQNATADSDGNSLLSMPDVKDVSSSKEKLPEWTQTPEVVVQTGVNPVVRFVVKSDQQGSIKDAHKDAIEKAIAVLSKRWKSDFPAMLERKVPIPAQQFIDNSEKQHKITKTVRTSGGIEYDMFEYHLQFEDSTTARQPIVDAWKSTLVEKRSDDAVIGFGIVALLLGTLSSVLRVFLAAPGYRKKTALAAGTFGFGTAIILMMA